MKPVVGGGIPPHHAFVELKMIFKDGGAFDFAATYERIKESLSHAMDMARESGRPSAADLSDINLEQLPAYEEATGGPVLQRPTPVSRTVVPNAPPMGNRTVVSSHDEHTNPPSSGSSHEYPPPNEPPPGYEETQQNSLADSLERSIRKPD